MLTHYIKYVIGVYKNFYIISNDTWRETQILYIVFIITRILTSRNKLSINITFNWKKYEILLSIIHTWTDNVRMQSIKSDLHLKNILVWHVQTQYITCYFTDNTIVSIFTDTSLHALFSTFPIFISCLLTVLTLICYRASEFNIRYFIIWTVLRLNINTIIIPIRFAQETENKENSYMLIRSEAEQHNWYLQV